MSSFKLLSVNADAKTVKGKKVGVLTGILYLAPANVSGYEVCPQRSEGCTKACLFTAGRAAHFARINEARIRKTKMYFEDRAAFMVQLHQDITRLVRKAEREGLQPVVRLNGTSDIPWERIFFTVKGVTASMMGHFPSVQFYDYTKVTKRAMAHARGEFPRNYHLTFSRSEENDADALKVLQAGGNVSVVFPKEVPPGAKWRGDRIVGAYGDYTIPVVDGDETDARFKDAHIAPAGFASSLYRGVIVGLKAKGKAKHDTSGFVAAIAA